MDFHVEEGVYCLLTTVNFSNFSQFFSGIYGFLYIYLYKNISSQ